VGWLRDLMLTRPEGFRSFGQLARALLNDASWPEDMNIRERSLATLLSKLDREQDLAWLGDRADVQAILARLLRCAVADLARPARADPSAASRLVRWEDLRLARTLDLTTERLPPIVPDEVLDPARWDRTFWVAPAGSGRTLVGQWLAARGLARFVRPDRSGALAFNDDAPHFVELGTTLAHGVATAIRRVCVAGAVPPMASAGWRIVHSPAIDSALPELVRWLLARLPDDTALDESTLLEWFRAGPLPGGLADSFGSIVGLVGVLDRIGFGKARNKSVLELARLDVKHRFDEAFGEEAHAVAWQRRNGVDVLIAMARRSLTDDDAPFTAPRTVEEWTALVPDEHKSSLDVEWLRVSLAKVDSAIRPSDVERAARSLSPGAFRIVRALTQAGLLAPAAEGRLAPAPRYLSRAVELEAERQLLDASPFEWGEALFRLHAAPRLAARLLERLRSGDSALIADVVELEASENPAYAVAVETAFRCAGLALLEGADLDTEALRDLWDAALDLSVKLPDAPPLPRIEHPEASGVLLSRGAFYLAALAIADALEERWPSESWRQSMYDAIRVTLGACDAQAPWFSGAFALIDRQRRAGSDERAPHALEWPGRVLDGIGAETPAWSEVRLSVREAGVLRHLWLARGEQDLAPLASALYQSWQRAGFPELAGSVLEPCTDAGQALFASAPAALALRALPAHPELAAHLPHAAWSLLCEAPPSDPALLEALAMALPESAARQWLGSDTLAPWVWRRHPELAGDHLLDQARRGHFSGVAIVAGGAPAQVLVAALEALEAAHEVLGAEGRDALRRWLHGWVGARQPGWQRAYGLLAKLES
jgi:hypothetical protein